MSLEKVENILTKNKWEKLLNKIHKELNSMGFEQIEFKSKKIGLSASYAKARTGVTYSSWAFAKDKTRTWVELELKPKKIEGQPEKQTDLYRFIKSEYKKEPNQNLKITWNKEDLNTSKRKASGNDIRIKVYLEENIDYLKDEKRQSEWISTMLSFVKSFDPIIKKYGQ
jgi:hypothetical protein